jgi:hypothetical protein
MATSSDLLTIYKKCSNLGATPDDVTTDDICTAIEKIYTDRFNARKIVVSGSSGSGSLPYRSDISQSYGYSVASDGKSASIWVNGYECASYSWKVSLSS